MAVQETRTLPAQFIEDLGKDYAKQLTATTAIPIDTSKFAPQVAAQDALQTQAATLAGAGVGSFAPFIQAAQQQATAAGQRLGDVGTTLTGIIAGFFLLELSTPVLGIAQWFFYNKPLVFVLSVLAGVITVALIVNLLKGISNRDIKAIEAAEEKMN